MSWILAHTFDIIKNLPKYIIKQKGENYNLLMTLYNCVDIETKIEKNIIDVLNDIFSVKDYYKKIDLQVFEINKQIFDYPKQITTIIDSNEVHSNVLFYYKFSSDKISLIKFIDYCNNIKTHKLVGISGFDHEQKPIFIKNRNNIFLIYESLHKCKILTNDIKIYPNMIYFKYKKSCKQTQKESQTYKEEYRNKEVLMPILINNSNISNISVNDQLTNITLPLFYDIITKIYKVQQFDYIFQNEIKTFVTNFIVMCNKYITTQQQQVSYPKQYYLNRTKKNTSKKIKKSTSK